MCFHQPLILESCLTRDNHEMPMRISHLSSSRINAIPLTCQIYNPWIQCSSLSLIWDSQNSQETKINFKENAFLLKCTYCFSKFHRGHVGRLLVKFGIVHGDLEGQGFKFSHLQLKTEHFWHLQFIWLTCYLCTQAKILDEGIAQEVNVFLLTSFILSISL